MNERKQTKECKVNQDMGKWTTFEEVVEWSKIPVSGCVDGMSGEEKLYKEILWLTETLKISKKEYAIQIVTGLLTGLFLGFGFVGYYTFFLLALPVALGGLFLGFVVGIAETKRRVRDKMIKRGK